MVNEQRLVEFFIALCKFNSPPKGEQGVAAFVIERLVQLGFSVKEDQAGKEVGGTANNLVATIPANAEGFPKLFFSAHFDTVEPTEGLNVLIEDGLIKSDGSTILGADDKAGMAAIIEAMSVLVEDNLPHGQIQLLFSICEEIGLVGARHLDLSLVDCDFGFVFDTSRPLGGIVISSPTHDNLEFKVIGKAAHAGNLPEAGVNAINVAALAISRMRLGRIDEETTANVGIIRGGQATNVVCPEVYVKAEARSRNLTSIENQIEHMKACFEEAAREMGAQVEIHHVREYGTYRLNEDEPMVQIAIAAAEAIGLNPVMRLAGGGSDANIYNSRGLKAVVVSTAMNQIHTHQENALIVELVQNAQYALELIKQSGRR